MTRAERATLQTIRGLASAGRIVVSGHAWQRMAERRVRLADLRAALVGATSCRAEPSERWRVQGPDLDGDDVTVMVVLEGDVVVVTVF
jgi:hypothetical protein